MHLLAVVAMLALSCSCTVAVPDDIHDELDFEPVGDDAKLDGPSSVFNRDHIVADDAFFEEDAFSATEVQSFLEATPYGGARSFLADERLANGERFSAALVRVAKSHQLNPLVLLVTLQKEAGLISRKSRPSRQRVDYAFGCGCPDNSHCSSAYRGIDKQLACAADRIDSYNSDLAVGQPTVAGWLPGKSKRTQEGTRVNPANRATAILYTYTPWVLQGTGGNWLFWNVWRRYALTLDYQDGLTFPFNEGYIGSSCSSDLDCFFDGARCAKNTLGQGMCTKSCDRVCPDRSGAGFTTTFCAAGITGGSCAAQCGAGSVCGPGQVCTTRSRNGEVGVTQRVCVLR